MTTTLVETDTTDARALATAAVERVVSEGDVRSQGTAVAIGDGIYLSAGHVFFRQSDPATPRAGLRYEIETGLGLDTSRTGEIAAADFGTDIVNGGWGIDGGTDIAITRTDDAAPVSMPMIVYADPNDASGSLTTFGFPSEGGYDGQTMVQTVGTLSAGSHSDVGIGDGRAMDVLISDIGMAVVGGQSGSGMWLTNDIDGDGVEESYIAGIVSLRVSYGAFGEATGFEPLGDIFAELGAFVDAGGGNADDFARVTLVSGQSLLSPDTTMTGTALHEDFIGSINADTLYGAGGDDVFYGGANDDELSGGAGMDRLFGGDGNDLLQDGAGKDNLVGGVGLDIFALGADGDADGIRDFESYADRIDVSAWGVTAFDQLEITDHHSGKVILRYQAEVAAVSDAARTLSAHDLDAGHFIFAVNAGQTQVAGTDGRDKLYGTALDETFWDGAEVDNLFGGAGDDIFRMAADGDADSIKDFELGIDRVDVSAWGATGFADLDIQDHHSGRAILRYGDEVLAIDDGARTMAADSLTESDFIFA